MGARVTTTDPFLGGFLGHAYVVGLKMRLTPDGNDLEIGPPEVLRKRPYLVNRVREGKGALIDYLRRVAEAESQPTPQEGGRSK